MEEMTSVEYKKKIIKTVVVIAIFVIGFIGGFIYGMKESSFSLDALWNGIMCGTLAGSPSLFIAIFLSNLRGSMWDGFGAYLISVVECLLVLLVFDFIARRISKLGISVNLIGVIGMWCFFVIVVLRLLININDYKLAVNQEANQQANSEVLCDKQEENEWLLK